MIIHNYFNELKRIIININKYKYQKYSSTVTNIAVIYF